MSIFSTFKNIRDRMRSDVQGELPDLDPTIKKTFIGTIIDSISGRFFDLELSLKQIQKELLPTEDSTIEAIRIWANYEGITEFVTKQSKGTTVFTGTVTSPMGAGSEVKTSAGVVYSVDSTVVISQNSVSVPATKMTRSGTTVTVEITAGHVFASNMTVTVAGAVETDYNGDQVITVLSDTIFTYEITGTPTTPATGTITASADMAVVSLTSNDPGADKNLDSGTALSLVSPLTGIDTDGYVSYLGLTGGTDAETKKSLFRRTQHSHANPVANFNVAAIEQAAFGVQGVTRVKVKRITPDIGDVTILFVRDDDDNLIPSGAEIQEVKDAIVELLQATSDDADVHVLAPTPVSTDYTFSAIVPDTSTMRTAIEESLKAFYEDEAEFETTIVEDKYRSAIINTIDPETGETLTSFTLTSPSADITVTTNELGVIGSVIFP